MAPGFYNERPIPTYVCHVGAYGGEHCGKIYGSNLTVAGVRGLVEDGSCSFPGDSGGPVYARHTAYGTIVAGVECMSLEAGVLGPHTYWQPITAIQQKLGVQVLLSTN
jgi:hypothetical protein